MEEIFIEDVALVFNLCIKVIQGNLLIAYPHGREIFSFAGMFHLIEYLKFGSPGLQILGAVKVFL
jgi:hypothetical protein